MDRGVHTSRLTVLLLGTVVAAASAFAQGSNPSLPFASAMYVVVSMVVMGRTATRREIAATVMWSLLFCVFFLPSMYLWGVTEGLLELRPWPPIAPDPASKSIILWSILTTAMQGFERFFLPRLAYMAVIGLISAYAFQGSPVLSIVLWNVLAGLPRLFVKPTSTAGSAGGVTPTEDPSRASV